MAVTLYYLSGSPYAWRVWLALEHKGIPYALRTMSYDAGDFRNPEFLALNPRHRVPVIVDDGFSLYESAAIVEYLEDKQPEPRLFSTDVRQRAVQRRMVREADQYFATALEHLVEAVLFTPKERWSQERIAAAAGDIKRELEIWETLIAAGDYLAGPLSAVDFTLFPEIALVQRIDRRNPGLLPADLIGPGIGAWMRRMEAVPCVQKTWPPHWKA
jgi:glutathione S-transferase